VLQQQGADDLLIQGKVPNVFSHVIDPEGAPITNQKASGRCWLFATTNMLRRSVAQKLELKEFQLSQSYLFFYDKLEKCNYFLDKIIDTYQEEVGSRLVQTLLLDPTCDGGQFTMVQNLLEKVAVVPLDIYPDVFSSTNSRKLNELLKSKLREFAEVLRENKSSGEDVTLLKQDMMKEIYKIMTVFLGTPPKPDEEFIWEYYDKDKKYHKVVSTPLQFYKDYVDFDYENAVSVINDPRNPYESMIKVTDLNNMTGGREVLYLNMSNEVLTQLIVKRIKANKPVFFGSHTPKYMHRKRGIMDVDFFQYDDAFGFKQNQEKASRVKYGESLMTHAMVITGVNIGEDGKPNRYRVENSWGKDSGLDGYYIMTQEYFEEWCYQVVVDKDEIAEYAQLLTKKPIELPLWDPMGALACDCCKL
jgi:bleomycin hydrolase